MAFYIRYKTSGWPDRWHIAFTRQDEGDAIRLDRYPVTEADEDAIGAALAKKNGEE